MLAGVAALMLTLGVGGASAKPGKGKQIGKLAAKQCAQERKALGNEQFTEIYGTPAQPNCMGVNRSEVSTAVKGASQDCRAERDELGVEAFSEKYGSNKNRRNAFGKCVSRKAAPELGEERAKTINAARACKAEREDPAFAESHDGKTFDQYYGTNKNLKNSFGKCVSSKANAPEPAPTA